MRGWHPPPYLFYTYHSLLPPPYPHHCLPFRSPENTNLNEYYNAISGDMNGDGGMQLCYTNRAIVGTPINPVPEEIPFGGGDYCRGQCLLTNNCVYAVYTIGDAVTGDGTCTYYDDQISGASESITTGTNIYGLSSSTGGNYCYDLTFVPPV